MITKDDASDLKSAHERVVQCKLASWRAKMDEDEAVRQFEYQLHRIQSERPKDK